MQTEILIGSSFEAGTGDAETVLNPAHRRDDPRRPRGLAGQVDAAVAAAERAFPTWSQTTPAERSPRCCSSSPTASRRRRTFAELESLNCGKPLARVLQRRDARRSSTASASSPARCASCRARRRRVSAGLHQHGPPRSGRRRRLDRALELSADDGGMEARPGARRRQHRGAEALRADAAHDAEARRARCAEIFPPGVVNIVVGRGETVGHALINHPGVRMISLTGDVATGKKVLERGSEVDEAHASGARRQGAGDRLRRCRPRGRGRRAEGVFGFYNAGQDCTAACRIYAGARIHDKLVADLLRRRLDHPLCGRDDDARTRSARSSRRAARARRGLRRARAAA